MADPTRTTSWRPRDPSVQRAADQYTGNSGSANRGTDIHGRDAKMYDSWASSGNHTDIPYVARNPTGARGRPGGGERGAARGGRPTGGEGRSARAGGGTTAGTPRSVAGAAAAAAPPPASPRRSRAHQNESSTSSRNSDSLYGAR